MRPNRLLACLRTEISRSTRAGSGYPVALAVLHCCCIPPQPPSGGAGSCIAESLCIAAN